MTAAVLRKRRRSSTGTISLSPRDGHEDRGASCRVLLCRSRNASFLLSVAFVFTPKPEKLVKVRKPAPDEICYVTKQQENIRSSSNFAVCLESLCGLVKSKSTTILIHSLILSGKEQMAQVETDAAAAAAPQGHTGVTPVACQWGQRSRPLSVFPDRSTYLSCVPITFSVSCFPDLRQQAPISAEISE